MLKKLYPRIFSDFWRRLRNICRQYDRILVCSYSFRLPHTIWGDGPLKLLYLFLRRQRPITKILGPKYRRTLEAIEININNICNLQCVNCSRSMRLAPSGELMTVTQIEKFIQESIIRNIRWKRINVQGGEPTLHPDIFQILEKLKGYKELHSPETQITLFTNGYGKEVDHVIGNLPEGIHVMNTKKTGNLHDFVAMAAAPQDSVLFKYADYSNGCYATSQCGIGLEPWGYYPCTLAGGFDRIFGFDIGRKQLPAADDFLEDQLIVFCSLCGNFRNQAVTRKEKISISWEKALRRYRKNKPTMSLY